MKKILYLISSIVVLTLLTSCSIFTSSTGLTPSEIKTLEMQARNTLISMPSKRMRPSVKKYIESNAPIFKATYTSSKRGKYTITWITSDRQVIQVVGEGDMLAFHKSFRKVTVSTFLTPKDKK